jgi:ATP-dependent helicase HepA
MFCIIRDEEFRGLGKVVSQANEYCEVEYFDTPDMSTLSRFKTKTCNVIKRNLARNYPIYYWNGRTEKWYRGSVIRDSGSEILVQFGNKSHTFKDYENIYTRCNKSIVDASQYLANSLTQAPQIAEYRSALTEAYVSQKNNAWGVSALLSSLIELELHQIRVIRRVLADPSQRYLLADEVGLGKTIEAGIIIRQAVLDDPENHLIVVLTPKSLVSQWKEELATRFGLNYHIDKTLFILPHEHSMNLANKLESANMVVIDEAHKISREGTQFQRLYKLLSQTTKDLKRFILLSATPISYNQVGFLRMLHLLDPVVYSLDNTDGFKHKVMIRLELGEVIAGLDISNIFFIDNPLDQLLDILPNDTICSELISRLRSITQNGLPDGNDPLLIEAISNLKAHLSETYKLDRRILRNRRSRVRLSLKKRSGGRLLTFNGSLLGTIEGVFEDWRLDISLTLEGSEVDVISELVKKIATSIIEYDYHQLEQDLDECRLNLIINHPELLTRVNDFRNKIAPLIKYAMKHDSGRLELLSRNILSLRSRLQKVVIFCSNKMSADKVFAHLVKLFPRQIVRHDRLNRSSWSNFGNSDLINVIVCDQDAEEGLNFQGGDEKVLIHFDLPFNPQRIEQRIGRLDRYGSTSNIKSIVIIDDSSMLQKAYFKYLESGLGIFDASISEIQYLVERDVNDFQKKLLIEGVDAILDATNNLIMQDAVSQERKNVLYQDELNAISETIKYENIVIKDDPSGMDFYVPFNDWVTKVLKFKSVVKDVGDFHDYKGQKFSYQPNDDEIASWSEDVFNRFEYALTERDWKLPRSYHYCNNRNTALESKSSNLRLLRYGDPLVEAVSASMEVDERGRSFAIWRRINKESDDTDDTETNEIYFCFEFLAQSNLVNIEIVLQELKIFSSEAKLSLERRANALFPPILERIWVDEEGNEVAADRITNRLKKPFNESTDTSLGTNQLKELAKEELSVFSNWEDRIYLMRDKAKDILLSRERLKSLKQQALERAVNEDRLREAQLTVREHLLEGSEAENERLQRNCEKRISEFLYDGFNNPKLNIELAGVVLLSKHNFSQRTN